MANDTQALKAKAAPGAIEVIEWALIVHQNTMDITTGRTEDGKELLPLDVEIKAKMFTLDEREEARKLLIEYGAGKPTRIIEHRTPNKKPMFETEVVRTNPQLPSGEGKPIEAEYMQ